MASDNAKTTQFSSAFSEGQQIAAPGNADGSGGANLKKPWATVPRPTAFNNARFQRGSSPVFYADGPASIPAGSTSVQR